MAPGSRENHHIYQWLGSCLTLGAPGREEKCHPVLCVSPRCPGSQEAVRSGEHLSDGLSSACLLHLAPRFPLLSSSTGMHLSTCLEAPERKEHWLPEPRFQCCLSYGNVGHLLNLFSLSFLIHQMGMTFSKSPSLFPGAF